MQAGKPLIDCTKKGLGLAGKHLFHGFSGKIAENRVETLPQKMLHLLCVFQKMRKCCIVFQNGSLTKQPKTTASMTSMQLPKEDTEMVFKFWFIFFLISFPGQFFSLLLDTKKKKTF